MIAHALKTSGIKSPTYANTTLTSRAIGAPRAIGHDGFHSPISVAEGLAAIWMGDDLRLMARGTVGILDIRARGIARLCGFGRGFPLGDASRQLNEVILSARAIPLRNPTRGERRRGKRGTLSRGGVSACHGYRDDRTEARADGRRVRRKAAGEVVKRCWSRESGGETSGRVSHSPRGEQVGKTREVGCDATRYGPDGTFLS